MVFRHPRLCKRLLDVCRVTSEYLTADELSARCDGDLPVKRVARYIMMLKGAGYRFDTRRRLLGNRDTVNEYRLIDGP
jgi:hypothetical protein